MELVPYSSPKYNPSWSEMFRSASLRRPPDSLPPSPPRQLEFSPTAEAPKPSATDAGGSLVGDPHARRVFCIAMAHAGLALSLLLVYGLYRLFHDFLRPLQWALLCSIPLRQLQDALVTFWTPPLLLPTLLAVPLALLRASAATLADFRSVLLRRKLVPSSTTFGFSLHHLRLLPPPPLARFLLGLHHHLGAARRRRPSPVRPRLLPRRPHRLRRPQGR